MGFRVLALDHVAITAPEELEDEVLDWYRNVLGLTPLDKPEGTRARGGWFKLGDAELHVTVDPNNPSHSRHFAVAVDDFDDCVARLRESGRHIEQARTIPGRRRCYTRDPAGNLIEIVAYEGGG